MRLKPPREAAYLVREAIALALFHSSAAVGQLVFQLLDAPDQYIFWRHLVAFQGAYATSQPFKFDRGERAFAGCLQGSLDDAIHFSAPVDV